MSLIDVVYPRAATLSGLREHRPHLYAAPGIFGAVWHGITGIKIEVISAAADIAPE